LLLCSPFVLIISFFCGLFLRTETFAD
jgi:hypothetical protein